MDDQPGFQARHHAPQLGDSWQNVPPAPPAPAVGHSPQYVPSHPGYQYPQQYQPHPGYQYPYQAQPAHPGLPPTDKSVGAALVLTFFFGALGLFYSSIIGGLIMSALFLIVIVLAVGTFGLGFILLAVIWPLTMLWAALSASMKHRQFETWRIRMLSGR